MRRIHIIIFMTAVLISAVSTYKTAAQKPVQTVSSVDLNKYTGKWYEIARFPNRFQRKCVKAVTANYTLNPNGKIKIVNECTEEGGKTKSTDGTASVADKISNAKLKVTFFWPFSGDYWILALGPNYDYALVGEPSRKYLWILSRTPQLADSTYQQLLKQASDQGFDVSKLVKTPQA